ncbi:NAD-dependent epimerase/dehydratase family protein [Myxococcota bacterium]|nr:NAD-dependent epimerase/dehydratase family protein [Myxococcota bacterium]
MKNEERAPFHVVAGAGQIGPLVAERLLARGLRVRMVRRGAFTAAPRGVETVSADLSDAGAAARAFEGAAVVHHTATPPYHRWREALLPLTRGIAEGAARAGARLVALDNLYMYGRAPDGVMREDSPIAPCSTKGALRAEAAELLSSMARRGSLSVVIARASDFVGPGAEMSSIFGARFWPRLFAGKAVEVLGDVDAPHSYSFTHDVADGLVTLGTRAEESDLGRVWHLPALTAEPTRLWVERFARAAGVAPKTTTLSPTTLRLFGLFVPAAGEVAEMIYQWRAPFRLDDTAFRRRFGVMPASADVVVRDTLAWARARYSRAAPEAVVVAR